MSLKCLRVNGTNFSSYRGFWPSAEVNGHFLRVIEVFELSRFELSRFDCIMYLMHGRILLLMLGIFVAWIWYSLQQLIYIHMYFK